MIKSCKERKRRNEAMALIKLLSFSTRDKEQRKLISGETLLGRLALQRRLNQDDNGV
jgi:hypothetical protein